MVDPRIKVGCGYNDSLQQNHTHLSSRSRNCLNNSVLAKKMNSIFHHLVTKAKKMELLKAKFRTNSELKNYQGKLIEEADTSIV